MVALQLRSVSNGISPLQEVQYRQTKAQVFVKFTRHVSKRNMGSHPPNRLAGRVCAQLAQLDNLV